RPRGFARGHCREHPCALASDRIGHGLFRHERLESLEPAFDAGGGGGVSGEVKMRVTVAENGRVLVLFLLRPPVLAGQRRQSFLEKLGEFVSSHMAVGFLTVRFPLSPCPHPPNPPHASLGP